MSEPVMAAFLLLAGMVIAVLFFYGSGAQLTMFNHGMANQTASYITTLQ